MSRIKAHSTKGNPCLILFRWPRTWHFIGHGTSGNQNTSVLLKEHNNKMTAVSFCNTHRSVPLSAIFQKVFFCSRRFRDPNWTMYKEWETLEQSVLNGLSSSNTSHLGSDIYVGQEMERLRAKGDQWHQGKIIFQTQQG